MYLVRDDIITSQDLRNLWSVRGRTWNPLTIYNHETARSQAQFISKADAQSLTQQRNCRFGRHCHLHVPWIRCNADLDLSWFKRPSMHPYILQEFGNRSNSYPFRIYAFSFAGFLGFSFIFILL